MIHLTKYISYWKSQNLIEYKYQIRGIFFKKNKILTANRFLFYKIEFKKRNITLVMELQQNPKCNKSTTKGKPKLSSLKDTKGNFPLNAQPL